MRTQSHPSELSNSTITTIDRDAFSGLDKLLMDGGLIDDEEWFASGEPVSFIARGIPSSLEGLAFNGQHWKIRITQHNPALN